MRLPVRAPSRLPLKERDPFRVLSAVVLGIDVPFWGLGVWAKRGAV